jgi:hypothetical protein
MNYSHKGILLRLVCAAVLLVGYSGTASASTCTVDDVILFDGISATSCGWSTDFTNDEVTPPPSSWSVNLDDAGSLPEGVDWLAYMKAEVVENGDLIGDPNAALSEWSLEEAGQLDGSGINLQFTAYTGTCDTGLDPECVPDFYASGEFTVNVGDDGRLLMVMKDGVNDGDGYHWYYFEGLSTGLHSGALWNTEQVFGGNNISHLTAYATVTVVPVPAAVWLFGSGLLGLAGIARRKKPAEAASEIT